MSSLVSIVFLLNAPYRVKGLGRVHFTVFGTDLKQGGSEFAMFIAGYLFSIVNDWGDR